MLDILVIACWIVWPILIYKLVANDEDPLFNLVEFIGVTWVIFAGSFHKSAITSSVIAAMIAFAFIRYHLPLDRNVVRCPYFCGKPADRGGNGPGRCGKHVREEMERRSVARQKATGSQSEKVNDV